MSFGALVAVCTVSLCVVLSTVMCTWKKCWKKVKDKEENRKKGKENNKSNFDTEMDEGYNKVHTLDKRTPPPPNRDCKCKVSAVMTVDAQMCATLEWVESCHVLLS